MKRLLTIVAAIALVLTITGDALAKKKPHVVIHKPPPHVSTQPVVPLVAVPPLAVFYDLARRTNCQGDVLGLGGPGFSSPITPATGNVMTTAYMRGECTAQPRRF